MDIDEALKSVNKYAKDYILYVARFFNHADRTKYVKHHAQPEHAEHVEDKDGRIIVHAMISMTVGLYLKAMFVSSQLLSHDEIIAAIAKMVGYWLFFAVVTYLLAWLLVARTNFTTALSTVLRVFPPAFLIGAAAILFVSNAVYALDNAGNDPHTLHCRGWAGLVGGATVVWGLVAYALPFSLSQTTEHAPPMVPPEMKWRRRLFVSVILSLLIVADIVSLGPYELFKNLSGCRAALLSSP